MRANGRVSKKVQKSRLHLAAERNDVVAIRKLISPELIEARDQWGVTPLGRAVKSNSHDAALLLIDSGADFNTRSYTGTTPLIEACAGIDRSAG